MAVCFVLATLVTTGLTTWAGVIAGNLQTSRTEKVQQVSAFVKSTQEFDPLVRAYMTAVLDGGDMKSTRTSLENNIHQQHILLGSAQMYLKGEDKREAEAYRATLVDIEEALEKKTRDPLNGKEFAQGIINAAVEREEVINDLRKTAGLETAR